MTFTRAFPGAPLMVRVFQPVCAGTPAHWLVLRTKLQEPGILHTATSRGGVRVRVGVGVGVGTARPRLAVLGFKFMFEIRKACLRVAHFGIVWQGLSMRMQCEGARETPSSLKFSPSPPHAPPLPLPSHLAPLTVEALGFWNPMGVRDSESFRAWWRGRPTGVALCVRLPAAPRGGS